MPQEVNDAMARPTVFGTSIGGRMRIMEVSIVPKAEESSRTDVARGHYRLPPSTV
jgi:hypothetical protein